MANDIRILRDEADEAGDLLQAAICRLALRGYVPTRCMAELSGDQRNHLASHYGVGRSGQTSDIGAQARAERECLRVIEEAAANRG